ncbi:MAG TPA: hypothetical protein VE913_15575, partial [Longimicrobium sp.]|nr:hypothetical protein [Longimicrobium sp.]
REASASAFNYLLREGSYGVSPDKTKVVIFSEMFDLATGHNHRLWETGLWSWRWSPGGDLLAFNGGNFVGVMNPDGSGRRILSRKSRSSHDLTMDWSGDGKYLILRTLEGALEVLEPATGASALLFEVRGASGNGFTQAVLK